MDKSKYAIGGRNKRTCAYDGGGANFYHFGAHVLQCF